ncbi:TetR/AcrR family transcriptional regulator [Nonomuraea sp. NN258]|uniref:TetR/AcrR family transcriptional regulator n=1 Tax=Nonomuraea antri TaxID=2730852 RepID=UPI0015683106|nr:TetR/AcrR family transcriptional regulator [Nonomuraea antri]NRQ40678.1 TetR/AcrR family transcriptional regulator [Nonomuraea antri]
MTMGLRELKKQRTRLALVEAAIGLFRERDYEQVTVAEIAEAAEVSTRTFFLHFQAKEDVLFANSDVRVDLGLRAVAERAPDERPAGVLARAMADMIGDSWDSDLTSGLAALRVRLAASAPALQARMLQRYVTAQDELARALHRAYPEELDPIEAAALVGAAVGAVSAATMVAIGRGDSPEEVRTAMRRAVDLVTRGYQPPAPIADYDA